MQPLVDFETRTLRSGTRPVIVLVPGAFGTAAGFEKLASILRAAGFPTQPGPYPSCNPSDPAAATSQKDSISLRANVLIPLLDREQTDVVVIAHSYGGVVAGGAVKGLDKSTRAMQGRSTGVVGLIYVAGNITLEGETLLQAVGGAYPPFIKADKVLSPLTAYQPHMLTHISAIQGPCAHRAGDGYFVQRLRPSTQP